jgi:excisionase family DNA binding protein
MTADNEQLVYTVEEARKKLRLSRGLVYQAIRDGQLPSIRVGRRILVPRAALEKLLEHGQQDGQN